MSAARHTTNVSFSSNIRDKRQEDWRDEDRNRDRDRDDNRRREEDRNRDPRTRRLATGFVQKFVKIIQLVTSRKLL